MGECSYHDVAALRLCTRLFHVSTFTKLGGLHRIIQAIMRRDDRLPHRFILAGDLYGRVAPGEALDPTRERNWRLDSAFYPDKSFWYAYGREGEWRHRIIPEGYVERAPFALSALRCRRWHLAGKGWQTAEPQRG